MYSKRDTAWSSVSLGEYKMLPALKSQKMSYQVPPRMGHYYCTPPPEGQAHAGAIMLDRHQQETAQKLNCR